MIFFYFSITQNIEMPFDILCQLALTIVFFIYIYIEREREETTLPIKNIMLTEINKKYIDMKLYLYNFFKKIIVISTPNRVLKLR